ncbi:MULTISPECIES: amino acid permease [unclassified Brevundimonas]|uniref:amino acid permease n=1 Tax=unclassified Brevundimonas TaxID=2622653 RepID=UPI0025C3993E|nr:MULTISPECIES: amino acid permease [unclassified Brevundimonas]
MGQASPTLARSLSWPHLIAMGVGAIVGTGILTLIGIGADKAGPAVLVSFLIAGFVCACGALCYAEMASTITASGSAYTYTHVVLGRMLAWMVGWSLILEYSLVVSAVAVSWSGYAAPLLHDWLGMPEILMRGPHAGGAANLPALLIIVLIAGVLLIGTGKSAAINMLLVAIKLSALAMFVWFALPHFNAANLQPFSPYGFGSTMGPDGIERGIMAAAAIIFSAFYGFDAIATAAEETKNPKRDLAIGIMGSMLACAAIYTIIALAALGSTPFTRFANSPEPLALILRLIDQPFAASFLAITAVLTLPTVILAFFYGQSRIFFVMSRDGLLPRGLSKVSGKGAPVRITLFTAVVVGTIALFLPLDEIVAMANAGTLVAFTSVALCMLVMRVRQPDLPRGFRTPMAWIIGPVAISGCLYLLFSLPQNTLLWFLMWNIAGVAVYFLYSRRNAKRVLAEEA